MNKTYERGDLVKVQYRPGYSSFRFGAKSRNNGASGVIAAYDEGDNTYRVEIENRELWFHAEEIIFLEKPQTSKPIFKVGDKVTFKSKSQCIHSSGETERYYYSGEDQAGIVGKIYKINSWVPSRNCYLIKVEFTKKNGSIGLYDMLESEMVEYDQISNLPPILKSKKTSLNFSY